MADRDQEAMEARPVKKKAKAEYSAARFEFSIYDYDLATWSEWKPAPKGNIVKMNGTAFLEVLETYGGVWHSMVDHVVRRYRIRPK
jgi:hypothetical protein